MRDSLKVLAIDDEEFNLDVIVCYLESAGYTVITAENGELGLRALEQHPDVSLILLDRMMPVMDGMTTLKHLKVNDRFKSIPVIMQTAAASSQQIEEGIAAGVYYYLAKPYSENVLMVIVRTAIEAYLQQQEIISEVDKQKNTIKLLEQGRFRFRTLEETSNLSYLVAHCLPNPHLAVQGLNELMMNAVEHGNLGISYAEKVELLMTDRWHEEIERRLHMPAYQDRFATLEFEKRADNFCITIRDMGKGFDWHDYLDFSVKRATDPNGRGIAIAKSSVFPSLEYRGVGNEVLITVPKFSS
jgi:CheY-like chemotaxis protein/anti-sigma regulatory factor (Ser/Thr protein kinase)